MSITRAREEAGLTIEELAGLLWTTPDTMRAWENGLPRPLRPTMQRIARAIRNGATNDQTMDRRMD